MKVGPASDTGGMEGRSLACQLVSFILESSRPQRLTHTIPWGERRDGMEMECTELEDAVEEVEHREYV